MRVNWHWYQIRLTPIHESVLYRSGQASKQGFTFQCM